MAVTMLALALAWAGCGSSTESGAGKADAAGDDGSGGFRWGDGMGEVGQAGDAEVTDASGDVNGFVYPCEPMTVQACVTACATTGKQKCLKEWGPCVPPEENCDDCEDNDCDGLANEDCPPNPACQPVEPVCPISVITIQEGTEAWTGDTLHLSASQSVAPEGAKIVKWEWSVQAPAGSAGAFKPGSDVESPTFDVDAAGQYLFSLDVWDDKDTKSCVAAQVVVNVSTYPPVEPTVGCADGEREGFVDDKAWPQIAGCSGAWDEPGITPDDVAQTCGGKGGDDGEHKDGKGCSSPDLCATGWHVCKGWQEVAQKSPTGCAGATPTGAAPKSLLFAMRQPSENGSVCGDWGDGFNDVFGCGNLGHTLSPEKSCGPLDRVLASTQANSCGFNEAEPNLGPWECLGGPDSHLNEGKVVTKDACAGDSCMYDGLPVGPSDKGGVLCCHD
jgi:hypothetical protein